MDIHADEQEEGRIVCKCFSLSDPYLRRKIKELGLKTVPDVTNAVKAGGACMSCHHLPGGLQDMINDIWGLTGKVEPAAAPLEAPEPASPEKPELSPFQFMKKVEGTLEEYVRPMLQKDGGDIELVDIKDSLIYCRLSGACAGCSGATQTMKMMVERTLKDLVDERVRVIQV